jgi:hypothetical protein
MGVGKLQADAKENFRGCGPLFAWFKDPAGNICSVLEKKAAWFRTSRKASNCEGREKTAKARRAVVRFDGRGRPSLHRKSL